MSELQTLPRPEPCRREACRLTLAPLRSQTRRGELGRPGDGVRTMSSPRR